MTTGDCCNVALAIRVKGAADALCNPKADVRGASPDTPRRARDSVEIHVTTHQKKTWEHPKDIVMEEVKSFNKEAFEMNQKGRNERMNRLLTNNPNTDECWNINAKN